MVDVELELKIEFNKKFKTICEKLMKQIEMVDFKDQLGHELKNNQAYTHFKDIVSGNK